MAQLAIKGHATRGEDVIEILEMFGGRNSRNYIGELSNYVYTINEHGIIDWYLHYDSFQFAIFTLEEFLKKFPYKIGDNVQHKGATSCGSVFEVEKMKWEDEKVKYIIKYLDGNYNCKSTVTAEDLQPYKEETMDKVNKVIFDTNVQCCDISNRLIKEETMEGKIESFEILESHCANEVKIEFDPSKFEIVKRDNGYYVVKKQPQYPKTYEECCKTLNIPVNGDIVYAGNWNAGGEYLDKHLGTLRKFQQLLICRDAYWKIAGDWKPNWKNYDVTKYCISTDKNIIGKCKRTTGNKILAFPTAEMRDAFFEYFKELIEQCKELL